MKISSTLLTVSILFDISHVLKAIEASPPDILSVKKTTKTQRQEQNIVEKNKMAAIYPYFFSHGKKILLRGSGTRIDGTDAILTKKL